MQEKLDLLSHTKNKHHTTTEERETHVREWKKSGLSMREYCRQNNLPISNFSGWKSSLYKEQPSIEIFPTALFTEFRKANSCR